MQYRQQLLQVDFIYHVCLCVRPLESKALAIRVTCDVQYLRTTVQAALQLTQRHEHIPPNNCLSG
jgi:hypothetical protein